MNPYASGDSTIGVASSRRGMPTVLPVFAAAAFILYRWNLKTYLLAIPKPGQPFFNYAETLHCSSFHCQCLRSCVLPGNHC
ncbi:hypothetical protein LOC67_16995 [Stieleria sp. JC731]|uniref:hypothetical protein n=1 Tax=Pirellulaceae TaxID=2691357 RepID=UPI001E56E538|nr:hypothetical protein [Stieleria sp. JC731]MCC9602255.1 hypothetical protein [Stieleria sp. JC731]